MDLQFIHFLVSGSLAGTGLRGGTKEGNNLLQSPGIYRADKHDDCSSTAAAGAWSQEFDNYLGQ